MPWSCAAGTKWVPIRPLVVTPQIAKPPASSQNVRRPGGARSTRDRPARARADLLVRRRRRDRRRWRRRRAGPCRRGGRAGTADEGDDGQRGRGDRAAPPYASRGRSTSQASTGRKTSWPVASPAVRMPVTRPAARHEPAVGDRRDEGQRHRAGAEADQQRPSRGSAARAAVMKTVSPLPTATISSATATTGRMPKRSISAAAKGAISPKSMRLSETAEPISAARPAELLVQRLDQHARHGPEGGRADERHEGDRRHDPGPVQPLRSLEGRLRKRVVIVTRHSLSTTGAVRRVAEMPTCARIRPCRRRPPRRRPRPHRVVVLAVAPVIGYDLTIPPQVLGEAHDADRRPLYDVRW